VIPVKELMTRDVITFKEDDAVGKVAETLSRHHITGAPVVDKDGNVVGIVSEVDVLTKKGKTAREIMSPHVIAVTEDTGVDEAAQLLAGKRIRRLPVLSGGKMVGLVSRSDILDFFALSHWSCNNCGHWERGLEAPKICAMCQGTVFHLEHGVAPGV
jgi:predicted transcriptional regulator